MALMWHFPSIITATEVIRKSRHWCQRTDGATGRRKKEGPVVIRKRIGGAKAGESWELQTLVHFTWPRPSLTILPTIVLGKPLDDVMEYNEEVIAMTIIAITAVAQPKNLNE